MDGFEFTKQVKSNSTTSHIPVILLTALNEDDDIIKGLENGADEYISKPFSVKHLELRIQKFIETNQLKKDHFSKSSFAPPESVELNTKDREFIDEITTIIEENLANSSFGVEELAKEMMISSSHFYRKLKTLTGQIPNAYLRKYRLNKAAELLTSNEGYNVSEVMYQIGIESSSYFSTAFKKLYGVSPSDYKK
jgi:AraC-like DNA-binding protein